MSIRSLLIGLVVGLGVAAAGGVALASIPDSTGVVHACYQNVTSPNKPVKLLNTSQKTTCPSGWSTVAWNQTGPQGPPGPSVNVVQTTALSTFELDTTTTSWQTVASVNVPAGSYLFMAKGMVAGVGVPNVTCALSANAPGSPDRDGWISLASTGTNPLQLVPFSLMVPGTIQATTGTVTVQCALLQAYPAGEVRTQDVRIEVLNVGSITTS